MINLLNCKYSLNENSMKNIFKILKVTVFLAAIVLLVVMLKNGFDSRELKTLIISANPFYIILGIIITAIGVVLKGKRIQILSKQFDIDISLIEATKIQTISIIFAMITPGRAGEFTKIFLLAKEKKELIASTTLVCIFERLVDVLILSFMSLALSLFALRDNKIIYLVILATTAFTVSLIALFNIEIFLKKISRFLPSKVNSFLDNFVENKSKLLKKLPDISIYTTIIWCIDALFQCLILMSIGTIANFPIVVGINAIVALMSILTILPMGLGTMDISALFLYNKLIHISKEQIVFLLASARLFGISTLLIMILPVLFSQKDYVVGLYKNIVKKKAS
jgi:uncharacterized protein (TIRG00374 family)